MKVKLWAIMAIVMAIVVLSSAALDKHEKIGKFGFTSLGITEVHVHVCTAFICVVCAMILYVYVVCILHLYMWYVP